MIRSGHVSSSGCAALNLSGLSVRSGYPLPVLRMALVDSGGVNVFVVVCREAEQSLVFGELIPTCVVAGPFEAAISSVVGVGNPRLENSFIAEAVVRNS